MKAIALLWCLAVALMSGGTVHAQLPAIPQRQLRGLAGVPVGVIEPYMLTPVPELKGDSLTRLAEATLTRGGVPILSAPRQSYLTLVVSVQHQDGPRAFSVMLSLWEPVTLSRDSTIKTQAVSWSHGVLEPVDQRDVVPRVLEAVRKVCEAFAADYTAVNARK